MRILKSDFYNFLIAFFLFSKIFCSNKTFFLFRNFTDLYTQYQSINESKVGAEEASQKLDIFQRINSAYAVLEDKIVD